MPHAQRSQQAAAQASVTQSDSSKEKARILLALLGKKGGETMPELGNGPEADVAADIPTPEALRASARILLRKLDDRKPNIRPTAPNLKKVIASGLKGGRLDQEHPAVIAIVIEKQSHQTQAAVLRGLPGNKARRVHRALSALRKAPASNAQTSYT